MGDRPGSSSRVHTSEDKVRKKDLCWSVRAVYVLEKRPDVSGPSLEEVGRYRIVTASTRAEFNIKHIVRVFENKSVYLRKALKI
jgi:hypothetical protein